MTTCNSTRSRVAPVSATIAGDIAPHGVTGTSYDATSRRNSPRELRGLRPHFAFRIRTSIALKLMRFASWLAVLIAPWIKDGR